MYKLENSSEGGRQAPIKIKDSFSKFQVNRLQRDSFTDAGQNQKRQSLQALKIQKARFRDQVDPAGTTDVLPGLEGVKSDQKMPGNVANDQSLSFLFAHQLHGWVGLTDSEKLKFCALFVLFVIGRAALCPLMAWVYEPVVYKILARSLVVGFLA